MHHHEDGKDLRYGGHSAEHKKDRVKHKLKEVRKGKADKKCTLRIICLKNSFTYKFNT